MRVMVAMLTVCALDALCMLMTCCSFLHIYDSYGYYNNIVFNNKKTTVQWLAMQGTMFNFFNNQRVPVVETFKYLGVEFVAKKFLCVDVPSTKRRFYAACNGVLNKCRSSC